MLPSGACQEAVEWASQFETLQQAWDACKRGDWMLWLIGKKTSSEPWSDERKPFLACALDCAEFVNYLWSDKIKENVLILRKWISGTALEDAKKAHHNLCTPCFVIYNEHFLAARMAYEAATAASALAYAVNYTLYMVPSNMSQSILSQCAEIVRRHFPKAP